MPSSGALSSCRLPGIALPDLSSSAYKVGPFEVRDRGGSTDQCEP